VTTFLPVEIERAQARGPVSEALKRKICEAIFVGVKTLAPRHAKLIADAFCQ
jgi:hypothetical protein